MKYSNSIMAAAASVCLLFACNSNKDYKSDDDTAIDKQTAIAQQSNVDTAAMNNGGSTAPAPAANDTATAAAPATSSTPASATTSKGSAKPNMAKKGHKGEIRMTDKMEEDKSGIYNYSEVLPMYPGGEKELEKFVQNHIQYPQDAVDNGVEGTVNLTFAVDETGKVYSPQVQGETLGYGLDDEAKKVVNEMPKWTPGRIKGKNVKTYYTLPITFTLL